MDSKICNKCGQEKLLSEFEYRNDKNSYRNECKNCRNKKRRENYNKNKEMINEKRREIYSLNKDEINLKRRNSIESDPIKKLKKQVTNTIYKSYSRKGIKRTKSINEILGHDLDTEIEKLLKQYKYKYKKDYDGSEELQVDHIMPIWMAKTSEELDNANRALQLLPAAENRRKGGKLANGTYKNGKVRYTYYNPSWFE
ncbi:MAG TPA: hypothetical protein GX708_13380 [Gallicola sp.]|nr:hypothetical protein [Gallicola sp.]